MSLGVWRAFARYYLPHLILILYLPGPFAFILFPTLLPLPTVQLHWFWLTRFPVRARGIRQVTLLLVTLLVLTLLQVTLCSLPTERK